MRFQCARANASDRGKSFEIDRFAEMATHPVDHSSKIAGQGSRWRAVDGSVFRRLISLGALIHPSGLAVGPATGS